MFIFFFFRINKGCVVGETIGLLAKGRGGKRVVFIAGKGQGGSQGCAG